MKDYKALRIGFLSILMLPLICCISGNKKRVSEQLYVSEPDLEFTKTFERNCCGFTGGDGTYSIQLPDSSTLWIFGDTFLGEVTEQLTRKRTDPMFIRNSFVLQKENKFRTIYQEEPDEFKSMMIPREVTNSNGKVGEDSIWFWPGDATIENNVLKVFVSEFHKIDTSMWGFSWDSTFLISYSLPELKELKIDKIEYSNALGVHYGHAVCEDTDYTYIYGLLDVKPHVARAVKNQIHGKWEFFDGKGWSENPEDSKPMIDITGSEQFSVFKVKNQYVFITQFGGFSKDVFSFTSKNPFTGWTNKTLLYTTPLPYDNKNLITYNALAHPQLTKNDQLLISYNVNSFKLNDNFTNAGIYRPRFIRTNLNRILRQKD